MKLSTLLIAGLLAFSTSAMAGIYDVALTKDKVMYKLRGLDSTESAITAAVNSITALEQGEWPDARIMFVDDQCEDLNSGFVQAQASKKIALGGRYAVQDSSFTIGTSYNANGDAMYTVTVSAFVPCLIDRD